jgi:hypothetical protein
VPARSDIRASDADRDRVVEALRDHAAAGRLDTEELESRTDRALAARTIGELDRLLHDLPRLAPSRWSLALREMAWRVYEAHLRLYLVVMAILVAAWAAGGMEGIWPLWPALGWGVGVASHRACLPRRSPPPKQPRLIARA